MGKWTDLARERGLIPPEGVEREAWAAQQAGAIWDASDREYSEALVEVFRQSTKALLVVLPDHEKDDATFEAVALARAALKFADCC